MARKGQQRGFFHKCCKLVLQGPSEKDLLTFPVADIRIITVGRVQKHCFQKENWSFRGKRKDLLIFSHNCWTIVLGNAAQQGKFSDQLRNEVCSPQTISPFLCSPFWSFQIGLLKERGFTFLVNMFNMFNSIQILLLHSRDYTILKYQQITICCLKNTGVGQEQ